MVVLCKVSKVIQVVLLSFIIGLAAGFLLSQGGESGTQQQALACSELPRTCGVPGRLS
ncbi:hypothetical protein [Lentzea jiangxiensis]|uniref:Uncharacterized protein n=1 Tax=Lentzea jiangxiensis TaxID=641025 RepID=A0A1H0EGM9_9PSEU|nr:hypothetical protein [Lentzea jiangxiensis]SDN81512.1 hypothetical protein SAMN05421507_101362 [Lentzea jiangxiensis]